MSISARRSHRGDDYQVAVAVHWLIKLLIEKNIKTVEVEILALSDETALATVDDIIITFDDNRIHFIQAKKNHPDHREWAISDNQMREELRKALNQTLNRKNAQVEFWSHSPFSNLTKLIESHSDYFTYQVFEEQAPQTLRSALADLSQAIGLPQVEAFTWSRILAIGPHLNTSQWEERNLQELYLYTTDSTTALEVLERMVRRHQSLVPSPIRREEVVKELEKRQVSVLQRSIHLTPQEMADHFASASGPLMSWPSAFPDGQWIQRPELDRLLSRITSQNHSVTLLLGDPGSGKSALLARLGKSLQASSVVFLAIKADQLSEEVDDRASLSKFLELPDDIVTCVRMLARSQPVVIMIDQLDALAELMVQRPGRLRVLLQLVRDLSDQANAHIIASCRAFEHRHDQRLRTIDAEALILQPPEWELVAEVLRSHGILADAWSESIRNDLRNPQTLDLFLQLTEQTDSISLLQGYHQMLDALWSRHVLCDTSGNRRAAAIAVASMMAEREAMWLPKSRFDAFSQAIDQLIAAGILITNHSQLSFRHQTLFEFVRARDFLERHGRLTDAVLSRQQSVRIRPLLWHSLGYMRSVDPFAYEHELESLWDTDLRPHLRRLMIDFMGQMQTPRTIEIKLILQIANSPKWQSRVLESTADSVGWFNCFQKHLLPKVMMLQPEEAKRCLPIFAAQADSEPDAIRNLIDRYWIHNERYALLANFVLEKLPQWSIDDADRLATIASRPSIELWSIVLMALRLSETLPEHAPRIIRIWSTRSKREQEPTDSAATVQPLPVLTNHEFHELPTIAKAAPAAFLTELWEWLLGMVQKQDAGYDDAAMFRRGPYNLDFWDEEDQHRELPVIDAFASAIEGLATSNPEKFIEFANQHAAIDQMIIQRLLARGMKVIATSRPEAVADFLLADRRRLLLGSFDQPSSDTKNLIRSAMPYLGQPKRLAIESMILGWSRWPSKPDNDAKTRFNRQKRNRELRLCLLRAIPVDYLSDTLRKHISEETRAVGEIKERNRRTLGMTEIGSPISAEQMNLAQDEHILSIFRELDDTQDWRITSYRRRPLSRSGGSIQAGRELEKLTKLDPPRGVRIALQLEPGKNEIPAGHVIRALSEDASNSALLYELIGNLVAKGFNSRGFVSDVAAAVQNASKSVYPPDQILAMLITWLRDAPQLDTANSDELTEATKDYAIDDSRSFLWGGMMMVHEPAGNFRLLSAVSHLLIHAEPPNVETWICVLEEHLQKREDWRVWAGIWFHLLNLHLIEIDQAVKFIDALLSLYPEMFVSRQGALLLGYIQRWAPSADVHRWIERVASWCSQPADQLVGEISTLHAFATSGCAWSMAIVDSACTTSPVISEARRLGMAFAIAELWMEPAFRHAAHPRLIALLRIGSMPVLRALSRVFEPESFDADQYCLELMDLIIERPEIGATNIDRISLCLLKMAPHAPEQICRATLLLLNTSYSSDTGSTKNYLAGEIFVQIALTLQEQRGDVLKMAADLFERLLELRIPYADEMLLDLDKRTTNHRPTTRFRHKRKLK